MNNSSTVLGILSRVGITLVACCAILWLALISFDRSCCGQIED